MTDREQPGRDVPGAAGHGTNGRGGLRVSHEDRDQVAEALRVAAGDGRLTGDELDDRLERALTARTFDDLAVLVADLPAAGTSLAPLPGAVTAALPGAALPGAALSGAGLPPARDLVTIDCYSGQAERAGRWAVPARMAITATSGQVRLDFTAAVISQPTLHIDVTLHSSQLSLVTRPGIVVDVDDVSVRSSQVKIREPWGGSVPVLLHVTLAGTCSSGLIGARPPRRTFWQWLRRAPRPYAIEA